MSQRIISFANLLQDDLAFHFQFLVLQLRVENHVQKDFEALPPEAVRQNQMVDGVIVRREGVYISAEIFNLVVNFHAVP